MLQNIFVGVLTAICILAVILGCYFEYGNPFSKKDGEDKRQDDAGEEEML